MINGVSNSFSSMSMTGPRNIQKPPPPPPDKDVFKAADSDGNGSVSAAELKTLLEGIDEVSGESSSVEDAIQSYDTDKDGSLSREELLGLLTDSGFPLPGPPASEKGLGGIKEAVASYAQNTGHDAIIELLEIVRRGKDESETYTSLDVTT